MKAVKHIIGVLLLFGLVLASPYLVEKLTTPRATQIEKAEAPEPKAPVMEDMPPQPSPPPPAFK